MRAIIPLPISEGLRDAIDHQQTLDNYWGKLWELQHHNKVKQTFTPNNPLILLFIDWSNRFQGH
jgi:hypothetical protein